MRCYLLKDLKFDNKEDLKNFCKTNELEYEFNNKKKSWSILDINEKNDKIILDFLNLINVTDIKKSKRKNEKHVKKIISNILYLNDNQPIHKIKSNNELKDVIIELNIKYNTDIDFNLYI